MKCKHIEILLADYLDKELSARDTARVEEHLQHCPKCTEELRFLKEYKRGISQLRRVKAPDDFLAKLHRRIERPARKDGVIQLIFFPLKIKLPLEAAGVCALVLIALFLFNPFRTEKIEYGVEETPRDATRERDGRVPAVVTDQKSYKMRHPMAAKDTHESAGKRLYPSEDNRTAPAEAETARGMEKGSSDEIAEQKESSRTERSEITMYLARREAARSMREEKPQEYNKQANKTALQDDTAALAKKEKKGDRLIESSLQGRGPEPADIEGIVHSLDGRMIFKVYDTKSKLYQQMIIEIPAKNYKAFLDRLSGAWRLRKQAPEKLPGGSTTLKINLQFEQ